MKTLHENKSTIRVSIQIILILIIILSLLPATGAQNGPQDLNVDLGIPNNMEQTIPLEITEISFSDDDPLEDDEITIFATISNTGPVNISNITISYYVDFEVIKNITNYEIGGNESHTINITWKAEKWTHNITVMLTIDDTPLKDTSLSKYISVEAKPIGDFITLVAALILIFVIVSVIVILPSINKAITGKSKKSDK
jgi:hypothetical protein